MKINILSTVSSDCHDGDADLLIVNVLIAAIIPIPKPTILTGIINLKDCTIESSKLNKITIMLPADDAQTMKTQFTELRLPVYNNPLSNKDKFQLTYIFPLLF